MSTNARIGMTNPDGTVTSIYTHWDGYPDHHAPILLESWTTEDQVRKLLQLGDLSILGSEIGKKHDFDTHGAYHGNDESEPWCLAYNRDRGETTSSKTHGANEWPDYGQEYEYVFTDRPNNAPREWRYRERIYTQVETSDGPRYESSWSGWKTLKAWNVAARLEELRAELQAETISYDELHELQSLAPHIDPSDTELLEAAGVPEHADDES